MTPEEERQRVRAILAAWPRCPLCRWPVLLSDVAQGIELCRECSEHLRIIVPGIDLDAVPVLLRRETAWWEAMT